MDISQLEQVVRRYQEGIRADERDLGHAKAKLLEFEKLKAEVARLEAKIRSERQKMGMSERELQKAEFDEVQRKGSVKLHSNENGAKY